jgi:serine phosphatase RsbU (regulator of sigma subunit)/pSer/pThr/pTyr-binding forkhead associated (FHA) protein
LDQVQSFVSDQQPTAVIEKLEHGSVTARVQVGARLLFGRNDDCDVVIENRRVSRKHAEIVFRRDQYVLLDLRSSNGTYLNGDEVTGEQPLGFGDTIEIDEHEFLFTDLSSPHLAENPTNILHKLPAPEPPNPSASRLQAVMSVTASISRSLTPEALFTDVLRAILTVFPDANRAFILTPDASDVLRIRSRQLQFENDNVMSRAPVSKFVAEKVMNSGEAMLSLNAPDDPQLDPSVSVRDLQIASLICAPILSSDNDVQGVIYVDSFAEKPAFDKDVLDMLATIATIVGQFVENSKLQETRLRAELLQRELQLAQDVQQMLIPRESPEIDGYAVIHEYQPAGVLAGDYVDYFMLDDGQLAIAIGDVVGKGAPAALIMARMHSAVRLIVRSGEEPGRAIGMLDKAIAESNDAMMFATFALVLLNPATHEITFVDAGHPPPIRRRGSEVGECFSRDDKGIVLGLGGTHVFFTKTLKLEPGDSFVLYTDGVTEAKDSARDLFGDERLIDAIRTAPDDAEAIRDKIVQRVSEFQDEAAAPDDMSIVVLQRT